MYLIIIHSALMLVTSIYCSHQYQWWQKALTIWGLGNSNGERRGVLSPGEIQGQSPDMRSISSPRT